MYVEENDDEPVVYVTTFSEGDAGAIYSFRLNMTNGRLFQISRFTDIEYPFYFALSRDRRYLYSTHSPYGFDGVRDNEISSFAISGSDGDLRLLNRRSTLGTGACFIDVNEVSSALVVSNYWTGSVASFAVQADGTLSDAKTFFTYSANDGDTDTVRQSRTHCISFAPDNRFALSADLGLDLIRSYRLDSYSSKLIPNNPTEFSARRGSGPRHLIFHPSKPHVYVANELDSTVTFYSYSNKIAALVEKQKLSTVPEKFAGLNRPGDLKLSPDGRFLYVSNRGHDSIISYDIDTRGRLSVSAYVSSDGSSPQSLAITRCGTALLCANFSGENVVVFRVNIETGSLSRLHVHALNGRPSCIQVFQ